VLSSTAFASTPFTTQLFNPITFAHFFSNRLGNFIYHTAVALYDFLFWSHFFSTRFSALAGHRTRFSSTSFSTVITLEMPPTFSSRDVTIGVRALVFDPFIHLMTQCSTLLFHQDQSSFTPNTTIYPQPYHPPTTLSNPSISFHNLYLLLSIIYIIMSSSPFSTSLMCSIFSMAVIRVTIFTVSLLT